MEEASEGQENRSPSPGRTMRLVAFFTVLGLLLRIAMAARGELWGDEAQFLQIVRIPDVRAMIAFLCQHESHPPLFYLLMRGWLRLFGDSEVAALALPVLIGTSLIPTAFYVGARVFTERTGLLAAVLVTTAPVLTHYSGFARPYSLLPLLTLVSVYLLWRGLMGGGSQVWIAQAVVNLAMIFTHAWAWLVFGAEVLIAGTLIAKRGFTPSTFRNWLLAQVAVGLACIAWLPVLVHQGRVAGHGPAPLRLVLAAETFLTATTSVPLPVLMIFLALSIARLTRNRSSWDLDSIPHHVPAARWIAFLLFAGVPLISYVMALLISPWNNMYSQEKCVVMLCPGVLLLISFGIWSWAQRARFAGLMLLLAFLSMDLAGFHNIKSNAFALAEAVSSLSDSSDIVVITPCWIAPSFFEYYRSPNTKLVYPYNYDSSCIRYDGIRDRLLDPGLVARFKADLEQAYRAKRRIWLVTSNATTVSRPKVVDEDRVPGDAGELTFEELSFYRMDQITRLVESRFGIPSRVICPLGDRPSVESLRACLYCPGDSSPATESLSSGLDCGVTSRDVAIACRGSARANYARGFPGH